jgi:hypothetical protein
MSSSHWPNSDGDEGTVGARRVFERIRSGEGFPSSGRRGAELQEGRFVNAAEEAMALLPILILQLPLFERLFPRRSEVLRSRSACGRCLGSPVEGKPQKRMRSFA